MFLLFFMGLFKNLFDKISGNISLATRAFTSADMYTGRKRLLMLAKGAELIEKVSNEYSSLGRASSIDSTTDDLDRAVTEQDLSLLDSSYDSLLAMRDSRRLENFARCLTETIRDYNRGSSYWATTRFTDDCSTSPALTASNLRETLNFYAQKLKSVPGKEKYSNLLSQAQSILNPESVLS